MSSDTDSGPMYEGRQPPRRKYVQFNPELNTGHLLQILVIAGGFFSVWGQMTAERAIARTEMDQIKREAAAEVVRTKESIGELKADVRKMGDTLVEMNLNLARMNAQMGRKDGP